MEFVVPILAAMQVVMAIVAVASWGIYIELSRIRKLLEAKEKTQHGATVGTP
jgi:hypothetical protein